MSDFITEAAPAEGQPSDSQPRKDSQTASEFIDSQLQLEADAREALPFSFDHCTYPLGPLRQSVFSCITCNPPPESPSDPYAPAGVCYACSIACHGEHTLVELFNRRNFSCDCGTSRLPATSPCTLRIDPATGMKGPVHSQAAAEGNTYNKNFRNRFCGCGELYDPHQQKGTMYQCLGLATESDGGCGEDWWHPECILGLSRDWYIPTIQLNFKQETPVVRSPESDDEANEKQGHPVPPGFPDEDSFESLICYKCVSTVPWIKRYANTNGFTYLVHKDTLLGDAARSHTNNESTTHSSARVLGLSKTEETLDCSTMSRKRKAEEILDTGSFSPKKPKSELEESGLLSVLPPATCHMAKFSTPPGESISLLASDQDFRSRFCRCPDCYPSLSKYPQLLEEEEVYEPPMSEDGDNAEGGGSVGTGSLLDRGEAALSNVDRVRAIEGVMVYNHLKDKVKSFLQPFAESGQVVGADDIKAYFEKLRGDAEAIRAAAGGAAVAGGDGAEGGDDNRREQSGY